jgi:DNA-binding transcriptional LysR family regulator
MVQREDDHLPAPPSLDELAVRQLPLRAIFALEVLARCEGRLHLAAKMQGVSTAAMSMQITRLETTLGVDVIKCAESDRRRFELTEKGGDLVEALRAALPALVHLSTSFREAADSESNAKRRRDARARQASRKLKRSVRRKAPVPNNRARS